MADVIVGGEKIAHFQDYISECPEDAIWHRDLQVIFWAGVKAGRMTKENSEIKIENISDPY